MVHHPGQRQGLHRTQERGRLPGRDERGNGQGRRPHARARRRRRLRRAAQAERAAQRPGLLSGPVRQADAADHPRRQAAPPRAQHGVRRRAQQAPVDRHGADGKGPSQADGQEGEGDRAEHVGAQGRLRLRRSQPAEAGSVRRRADGQDARDDPDRGQRRRGHRLHDGRRHLRRLVSDHAVLVAVRVADRLPQEVPEGSGDRQGDLRGDSGGRRARRARHGARRRLGGRPRR